MSDFRNDETDFDERQQIVRRYLSEQAYINPSRKRELLAYLERLVGQQDAESTALDNKALDLLRYSATVLVLIITVSAVFVNDGDVSGLFVAGFVVLLLVYAFHVQSVLRAIYPRDFSRAPEVDPVDGYNQLMQRYVSLDEDDFLNQLIADYAGDVEPGQTGVDYEGKRGVIQINHQNLASKARRLQDAVRSLVLMIVGSIFTLLLNTDFQEVLFLVMLAALGLTFVGLYFPDWIMGLVNRMRGRE